MLENIISGFSLLLNFETLLYMLLGTSAGLLAGALPGLTATMSVALIVPFTFVMAPATGLATLGAIYCGAIFGGSFSAILVNTPGTPSSIATTFDGYPMVKQGRAKEAIFTATFSSAAGGIIGTILLITLAIPLSRVALSFGPPEYFWISILGLTIIASLASKSIIKGLAGGVFGLLISMIGIAPVGGDVRFTFGIARFQGGMELISVLIGLFCIPEIFRMIGTPWREGLEKTTKKSVRLTISDIPVIKQSFYNVFAKPLNYIRSSLIGGFIGILPGAGGAIANLVAYNEAQRASKDPDSFGKGNPAGVVASESANNAMVEGSLVPLLTLGVPGSPAAAVIYGSLMLQGLRPGPSLFEGNAPIAYSFMLSFLIANLMMFAVGLFGGNFITTVVSKTPTKYLAPAIFALTIIGSFSIRNNIFDVYVMIGSGFLGYFLKELNFHPGPIVLGVILGPIAERGLVQGYLIGMGLNRPWTIFFTRPISVTIIIMCIISATWPFFIKMKSKFKERSN